MTGADLTINLFITKHAWKQMRQRGIDEDQIIAAIKRGSRYRQTEGFKSVHSYIGVCYKIVNGKYYVKTVTVE